jgi:ATP-dependent Lon protease
MPGVADEELDEVIKQAVDSASNLAEEYSGAKPLDEAWKAGIEQERVDVLEPLLQNLRQEIEHEEPTMDKILDLIFQQKINSRHGKVLVQLYDIYHNTEPYTHDHHRLRQDLVDKIAEFSRLDAADMKKVEEEEKRLMASLPPTDLSSIQMTIINLKADDKTKATLLDMYKKLLDMSPDSESFSTLKQKLLLGISLPHKFCNPPAIIFEGSTPEQINEHCNKIREELDKTHYGMDAIKDELLCMHNDRITNPNSRGAIGLVGMRGTGKTSIIQAYAKAVGKPFYKIALGGMTDPTPLKGSDGHWVGSGPSAVVQALKMMKVANGVLLIDEIDKPGMSDKGIDIQNALLHISDYTQNHEFMDLYLPDFPHDLSNLEIFYTMNEKRFIDPTLLDRLTIFEVEPYSRRDIREIAKNYKLPDALKNVNIPSDAVTIDDSGCNALMDMFCDDMKEDGVRPIQKALNTLASRINYLRTNQLPDGTFGGRRKPRFAIPNFKLPLVITREVVQQMAVKPKKDKLTYFG